MFKKIFPENSPIRFHHLIYFVLLLLFLPKSGFYFDTIDRPAWAIYMLQHGVTNVYGSGANYLPLPLYLLYIFGLIFKNPADITTHFYLFKIVVLLFDFAAAIGLTYAFRKFLTHKYLEYGLLLSPAFLYNTIFWNQQDGIHSALIVFSFIFLLNNKPTWGVIFALLSINAKLQSIIILPVVGIILLYYLFQNYRLLLKIVVGIIVVQGLILLPFLLNHQLKPVLEVMKNSVGFFPKISWGAYNLWYLLTPGDPAQIDDNLIFHRFTYKTWGFLLFFLISSLALLPLFTKTVFLIKFKQRINQPYFALVFLTMSLLTIAFFFVNTQMHERYSHPALLLFFGYGLLSGRYLLYVLTSVAYFLNLDGIYRYFNIYLKIPIVKPEIVALIYALVLIISFVKLYRDFDWIKEARQLID